MTGQVVLTGTVSRKLLAAGASGRCERCGRLISRGRAAWSRDEYGAPLCGACEPKPLDCSACGGEGEVEVIAGDGGCNSAGYPIPAYRTAECDHCGGDGLEPCAHCGARAAVVETEDGNLCAACAAEEE